MTLKGFAICLFALAVTTLAGCGSKEKLPPPAPESKAGSVTQALSPEEAGKLKRAVTEGDELWNAAVQGVKEAKSAAYKKYDEAFEKYMVVVNASQPLPDKAVMARVYGRVIDVAVSRKNNKALAKEVAVKSLRQRPGRVQPTEGGANSGDLEVDGLRGREEVHHAFVRKREAARRRHARLRHSQRVQVEVSKVDIQHQPHC